MILYNTKYLQLKKTDNDWFYAHRPNVSGVVVILPIIERNKILMVVQRCKDRRIQAKYQIKKGKIFQFNPFMVQTFTFG